MPRVPNRNIDVVVEALNPIVARAKHRPLHRVSVRAGLVGASDGRVLIRVEMPGFIPSREDEEASYLPILDLKPEEPTVRIAGRDWIAQTLGPAVEAEWNRIVAEHSRKQDAAIARFNQVSAKCPCCGADIAIVDDEGFSIRGRLRSYDEFVEDEAPPPVSSPEFLEMRLDRTAPQFCFYIKDLKPVLDAATRLGGADELLLSASQLRFVGRGFLAIVVARAVDTGRAPCLSFPLPESVAILSENALWRTTKC